jgi:hypothetical protein
MSVVNTERPEINFRRTSAGWIFRSPAPWIIGPAPHYLVDDEQKARITAVLKPTRPKLMSAILIAGILGWAGAVPLMYWAASSHPNPTSGDFVWMVILIVLPMLCALSAFGAIQQRRLAPILTDAQPTDERITYAEMRSAVELGTSPRQARRLGISSAIASACFAAVLVAIFMDKHTLLAPQPLIFAFLLVMNAWQAVRWYRASRRPT